MPKYFNPSSSGSLFKSLSDAKADAQLAGARSELQKSADALETEITHKPEEITHFQQEYDSAKDNLSKIRYGIMYLKNKFSDDYKDFIDAIEDYITKFGIDNKNPFVKFMETNGDHANEMLGNKNFIEFLIKKILDDKSIVENKKSYIYNKLFQNKAKVLNHADALGFFKMVDIIFDSSLNKRYFSGSLSENEQNKILNELVKARSFKDMIPIVDRAQEKHNKGKKK